MPAWAKPEVSRFFFGGKEYAIDLLHSLAGGTRQFPINLQPEISRITDTTLMNQSFQSSRIRSSW